MGKRRDGDVSRQRQEFPPAERSPQPHSPRTAQLRSTMPWAHWCVPNLPERRRGYSSCKGIRVSGHRAYGDSHSARPATAGNSSLRSTRSTWLTPTTPAYNSTTTIQQGSSLSATALADTAPPFGSLHVARQSRRYQAMKVYHRTSIRKDQFRR